MKDIKARLDSLYEDLTVSTSEAEVIIGILSEASNDKKELLSNIYFRENSPLKIINTEFMPAGKGDTTAEMIDISMKFDDFMAKLQDKAGKIISRHKEAVEIFFALMDLEGDYSELLYLRYVKRYSTQEIWDKLHMSRAKYFRCHMAAVEALRKKLESSEGELSKK